MQSVHLCMHACCCGFLVQVGKVAFDIRFWNAASEGHKDDIRQRFVLKQCGNTQLPVKLAPGAKLVW